MSRSTFSNGCGSQVALAALQLKGAVGRVPQELRPGDLADRRLQRVVGHAGVDQAAGQVAHRLEPEQVRDHPADLVLDQLEVGQRPAELVAIVDVVDRLVQQPLGRPHRARPQADAAVVEDLHRDVEALAGLAEHVLGRHPHVLEVEAPQVVAPQPHGVVALADLEALHPRLDDQRDVAVLAVHLAAGEGREHRALAPVADVALLPVQHPGPVGLLDRAAFDVVGVRAGVRLGEREPGQLAPGGEVGEEALLLLLGAEQVDALEADRLVDAEDDRQRGVDPGEGLEHARVAGLREALAAVALRDVEAAQAALAQLADHVVADPAVLLDLARVKPGAELVRGRDQRPHVLLLGGVGLRPRKDQVLVDLAQEQGLRERGAGLLGPRLLHPCLGRGLHQREGTLPRAARPSATIRTCTPPTRD